MMGENSFIIDLENVDQLSELSEAIAMHLEAIVTDMPSDLDANAIRDAIELYVSDVIQAEIVA
jgi:hypothetical protein